MPAVFGGALVLGRSIHFGADPVPAQCGVEGSSLRDLTVAGDIGWRNLR